MTKQMLDLWINLWFWWLPTMGKACSQIDDDPVAAAPERPVERPPFVRADLTVIKGIGPAMQTKLSNLNIHTFADLAEADPNALMAELKGSKPMSLSEVRGWTESAKHLAQG